MLNLLLIINLTSTCNVTKPGKCRYTTLQYNGPLLCICSYIKVVQCTFEIFYNTSILISRRNRMYFIHKLEGLNYN